MTPLNAVVRALVDGAAPGDGVSKDEALLRRNVALVRVGEGASGAVGKAAAAERERVDRALRTISELSAAFDAAGIVHVFPKAFQHLPDMGHDIDMLVGADASATSAILSGQFRARPGGTSVLNRVSGKTSWVLPEAELEIHHGRMGIVGENAPLAQRLLAERVRVKGDWGSAYAIRPESLFVVQAIQRVTGHFSLRATDAASGILALREGAIDLREVARIAEVAGATAAVAMHVACLGAIHARVFGTPLKAAERSRPVRLQAQDVYAFNAPRVVPRVLASKLASDVRAGRWRPAARVAAIPMFFSAALVERAWHKVGQPRR